MATRNEKIRGAAEFKRLIKNGNGRKRTIDDLLDSYRTVMKKIMKGGWR